MKILNYQITFACPYKGSNSEDSQGEGSRSSKRLHITQENINQLNKIEMELFSASKTYIKQAGFSIKAQTTS